MADFAMPQTDTPDPGATAALPPPDSLTTGATAAQPAKLPTADEFFAKLPSADEFFGKPAPSIQGVHLPGQASPPLSSPAWDEFFSHSPAGKVLDAFGQGVKQGWGEGPVGLDPEDEKQLRDSGVFNDYAKGQSNIVKAYNEAIIRPLAQVMSLAARAPMAGITGGAAAVGELADETGLAKAVGLPGGQLARDIAGIAIQEGASPARAGMPSIERARSLGVIGEGEAGFMGTAEPGERPTVTLAEEPQAEPPAGAPAPGEAPTADVAPPAAAPSDIHAAARQIAPDVMQRYDALTARQDTYRRWIDELDQQRRADAEASPEAKGLQAQVDGILGKVGGVEDKLTKAGAGRLEAARAQLDDLLHPAGDSADMAKIRGEIQKADYAMRDLAPQVSDAYRQAQEMVPETAAPEAPAPAEEITENPQETAAESPAISGTGIAAEPEPPRAENPAEIEAPAAEPAPDASIPRAPDAQRAETTPEHIAVIAADVGKKLAQAGRPPDEATAAGQIVAARYEARAAAFDGAKGTALDLYRADNTDIRQAPTGGRAGQAAGKTVFKDGQRIVTLFGKADASTFMHETGHMWLEDLVKDAADDQAPEALKTDAKTVRDWLGAKDGEAITTRQHEKFARGFEQYLYEGRAPSPGLVNAFAQFRGWLTAIYDKMTGLGRPISDDIRDVFDRLIAKNPERQKAGEPKPVDEMLASLHKTDAEITPPQHADALGDLIEKEVTGNADGGGAAGEADQGGGDAGGAPGGAAAGGTGRGAGAREPADVAAGAGEASAEGAAVRKGPSDVPAGPNEPFGRTETDLIDKAGNIRLDNLDTPDDIKDVLRETARQNGDFVQARRGKLSDAEVLSLSESLGVDPSFLKKWQIGKAYSAEEIKALEKLLAQSTTAVRDAAVKAATGTDEEVIVYAEAKARHQMIQEQYSAVTAEGGRAFRALKKTPEFWEPGTDAVDQFVKQATGKTLFQMRKEAEMVAGLETPAQISKMMNDARKPGFGDMLIEYYVNNLISGPATHTTYMVGNSLMALHTALLETPVKALVGAAKEAAGMDVPDRVYFGEVASQLYGTMRGYRDGLSAAWDAFKANKTGLLPGEEARPDLGIKQGAIPGVVGEVVRLPSRAVTAIHSFYRTMNYEREIAALTYRQATKEGLEGDAFDARVAELRNDPTPELMQGAVTEANALTLMKRPEYGSAMWHVERFANSAVPLKMVLPFVRIGTNIAREALVERTLIGLASQEVRDNLAGRNGSLAQDSQIARIGVGTAIGAATVGLAMEGLVTGAGPSDPKQAAVWRQAGNQPYSVRFGDTWVPYKRLGVLGMIMGTSAEGYELAHHMSEEDASKWASSVTLAVAHTILDETWMRGVSDLMKAFNDPDRYGKAYIRNLATDFVPFSIGMGQIASATDPYLRQAQTITEAVRRKIPGESQTLLPRRDIYGEPIRNQGAFPMSGLSALYISKVNNDPVTQQLLSLGVYPSALAKNIRGVKLDEQQYDDFQRVAGRYMKMRLDALVRTPGWQTVPEAIRRTTMLSTIASAREQGRDAVMMQYPSIVNQAVEAKVAKLRGPVVR